MDVERLQREVEAIFGPRRVSMREVDLDTYARNLWLRALLDYMVKAAWRRPAACGCVAGAVAMFEASVVSSRRRDMTILRALQSRNRSADPRSRAETRCSRVLLHILGALCVD
ncbi:MAG TPA: hypothetical protein VHN14_14080 [Kofleriaceae bacterium]|nr:hypothetical protein [Kofleriaceae bacterium]